jgi:uncharacterized membrane protein
MSTADIDIQNAEKETGRVDAFSDGVFAIAITLLALELHVPREAEPGTLLSLLAAEWPSYLAFLTSFATIGIMWINHHRMFKAVKRVDHGLLVLNTLLLLGISVVPFPTALLSEYLGKPDDKIAALVYCGVMIAIAIFFNVLWRYIADPRRKLMDHQMNQQTINDVNSQYIYGPLMYVLAFLLAFISAGLSFGLCTVLAIFYILPRSPLAQGD